ncbi:hypothetical protein [Aliarcobacter butzleri]|uniref:hypothetical protein n=1 Tax=Aliarcobacter butzleri TaxID=28197 RepID=UPI0021B2B668|nr:hypothetical protein [Aliarcobacter butzleri]UXC28564.1 hypothetical protein N3114_07735 [Aliarcobacter butzleri]UXC29237.1 hypothetical protein N3114_11360 [Aliarcobacter butzleri]
MKVQIIVADNLVIIDNKGINFDCSRFKDEFIFCEVNENERWIEKNPFKGREKPKDWTKIETFISEVELLLNKEKNTELIKLKQYLEDIETKIREIEDN